MKTISMQTIWGMSSAYPTSHTLLPVRSIDKGRTLPCTAAVLGTTNRVVAVFGDLAKNYDEHSSASGRPPV